MRDQTSKHVKPTRNSDATLNTAPPIVVRAMSVQKPAEQAVARRKIALRQISPGLLVQPPKTFESTWLRPQSMRKISTAVPMITKIPFQKRLPNQRKVAE